MRAAARTFGGPDRLAVRSGVPLAVEDATMPRHVRRRRGRDARLRHALGPARRRTRPPATEPGDVAARLDDTAEGWRSWEAEHDVYDGPNRELVRFCARVLKGLTYRPTGAIVAAPTASLPETVGGERNWDYRYAWVRDASLTVQALYIGSCSDEAEEFVSFMTSSAGGRADSTLQIMYGIDGSHDLSERELDHLRGWRDSRPVRVGNGAWDQTQLDVYGELLDALALTRAPRRAAPGDPALHRRPGRHGGAPLARAGPGMWEMRGEPQHHLSSKVMCWVALDRAVQARAAARRARARTDAWAAERDRIREAILERGWSERQGRVRAGLREPTSSTRRALLMPIVGFLPATDPRMRSTIDAIADELTEDGLVLRYRDADGLNADGLDGEEGTFVHLLVLARVLPRAGGRGRARARRCSTSSPATRTTSACWPRRSTRRTGEQLGNFPQAFSHIGLIMAASQIDRARA